MNVKGGVTIEISLELREECVKLFDECAEFNSPKTLRAFATVVELKLVRKCIPNADRLDYDTLITDMLMAKRSPLEPVLFDLLDALASRYREDSRGPACTQLKEKIREALLQAENPEQTKDYQRLVRISASGDGQGVGERAARWIEETGDDLDERALRITLAVFHGTPFEVIERAKNDLLEALKGLVPPPPPPDPEAPPPPTHPHVPLMRRLKLAGAYETDGRPPDWKKVIELERPELASEAISHVWQLYRETKWRQKLIGWLTSYVAGRPAEVRTRAAVAAGILAIKDYRFVRDNLLERWVQANNAEFRTAIGMALGVLAREADWAAEVQSLLRNWSRSPQQAERWAALRAYIYVGAYCRPVSEVIARWRDIAASEFAAVYIQVSQNKVVRLNNPMHMSLMDATVRFFVGVAQMPAEEKRPLFAGILEGLTKWIAANEADAGLGFFMFTALGRLAVSGADNGEADGSPVLLQLVEEGPGGSAYRAQLAGLFEVAMRSGATITEAKELLRAWLGWADGIQGDSQLSEARLRALFKDMIAAGGDRMRGRLVACLRDCGRNRTAQRILSGL